MDKNKSRTDLLAAGRKKLQQFRQKKDNSKGSSSSSHGKSSKKSSKLDSDSNASSVTSKPTGLPEVLEGEILSHVDSRSGDLDSSVSGSLDNPVDPDSDMVAVDIPLATEIGLAGNVGENPELHMEEMLDIDSSGPDQGKIVHSYEDQGERVAVLDNPEVPDFEGVKERGDTSSSVHLADSSSKGDSADGMDITAEADSINREQQPQLVIPEEGDQLTDEADGLGSNQFGRSSDIEHDQDGRLLVSEHSEIAETKLDAASGQAVTGEATSASIQTVRTDDESVSVSATNIPDGTSDLIPGSSNVENSDVRVQSCHYGDNSVDSVQDSSLVAETYSQQYMPEDSFIFVEKNNERPLSPELKNSSESYHLGFSCPISIPQLVEVIKGLPEDEFRLLLNSRELDSNADMGPGNSPPYGLPGSWERIKEELFVASCVKDVLHMQLTEQNDAQINKDLQFNQLNGELSMLHTSLEEADQRNAYLSEALSEYKSELEVAGSEKEELQQKLHAAKAEFDEVCARGDALQNSLERSNLNLSGLSKELADCKNLIAVLHTENESLNGTLALLTEERNKHVEEKDSFLNQNEKLLKELADCKNLVAALHVECSELSGNLALVTEERNKVEGEKESLACGHEKLSLELSNLKDLVEALHLENGNLNGKLELLTEEREKLEEQKKILVQDNDRLSSQLLVLGEMFSKDHVERDHLEVELKEMTMCLENLREENLSLGTSLEMHKANLREINERQVQLLSPKVEAGNQGGSIEVQGRAYESATDHDCLSKVPANRDVEATNSLLEETQSKGQAGICPYELFEPEVLDDSLGFMVMKRRMEEAANTLQKLEKAIEEVHSHSASLSRSGGKMGSPAVSKLIQAFESKVHHDEQEAEAMATREDQLLLDSFASINEFIGTLKAVLKQLATDAENSILVFKREQERRSTADFSLTKLKVQFEDLEEDSMNVEARNIELLVLYEAVKSYAYGLKERNNELEVLYETLQQENSHLKVESCELGKWQIQYKAEVEGLQMQLHEMQLSSNEMASLLQGQLENFQKEAADKASTVEQEWNATITKIIEAVQRLDDSCRHLHSSAFPTGIRGNAFDASNYVAMSVNTGIETIEDLKKKLEAEQEASINLSREANEKCSELLSKTELANETLQKLYSELRQLIIDSCGSVVNEINIDGDMRPYTVDYGRFKVLVEQLRDFLADRLQLESVNSKLSMELTSRIKDVEELNSRCLDLSSIQKLIEDVEGLLKLEDGGMEFGESPVSRLASLVSFLIRDYKEVQQQVSSREEFGNRVIELTDFQEKIQQLTALNLQQDNEILLLKQQLGQVEEALVATQSGLQEKVNELVQSEQRMASIREKLGIAVAKGKGLVTQRDNLKQSLVETSSELERCSRELQLKDASLNEVETTLKMYLEAGERVEALESELSYIRNSATALRESFLLKDSVLQRIEEILEDLELPEDFHSRDIIEKVDWLARSASVNSLPPTDWDQKSSVAGSYSDASHFVKDSWKGDAQPGMTSGHDLRRKYEELQNKFFGLAEQNEMLEQSLMERNHLVQRWEEMLGSINMPSHLRSVEPEERIEWLGSAILEVNHDRNSLLEKIDKFESHCASLGSDLEESQHRISLLNVELEDCWRRKSDLEMELKAVIHERELLSERLDILTSIHEELAAKAVEYEVDVNTLQNEVTSLEEELVEKRGKEEYFKNIDNRISRLKDLVFDAMHEPDAKDLPSGGSNMDCLEVLLGKLIDEYMTVALKKQVLGGIVEEPYMEKPCASPTGGTRDTMEYKDSDVSVLKSGRGDVEEPNMDSPKKHQEEILSQLKDVKEERDRYMEMQKSLAVEVETLNKRRVELQELLNLEEQKSNSFREKLNVAVRKGKSVVQQRDILKQNVEELNSELEHLKSDIKQRENALGECEKQRKDLVIYSDKVGTLESENSLLRNQLAETKHVLQEKEHTLTMVLDTLRDIEVGGEFSGSDPLEKLRHIGKLCGDLHEAVTSLEQDSKKSRRAAELLLAELNEVQDQNDHLQEELLKATEELTEVSRERDVAGAATAEALSRLEKLSLVHSEEQKKLYSELLTVKSATIQLRKGFSDINSLLAGLFCKDLEFLQNLEAGMESCLRNLEPDHVVHEPLFNTSSNSGSEDNRMFADFLSEMDGPDHFDGNFIIDLRSSVQECMKKVEELKVMLHEHSVSLHQHASNLSKLMGVCHRELTSQRESYDALKKELKHVESIEEEKEREVVFLQRNLSLLYEACSGSLMEIENMKAEAMTKRSDVGNLEMVAKPSTFADGGLQSGWEKALRSEEHIKAVVDRLFLAVKSFTSLKDEWFEGDKKEMRITISNLQKELQEKDAQREKICMELVSQIKEAEVAARGYSLDLQSSKTYVHELEKQVAVMEDQRSLLEQQVKELQDGQAISAGLQEKIKSLSDTIASKDHEIEELMQALDEEEVQMEDLRSKIEEREKVLQQKSLDVENLEASRAKVLKKLSVTVSKFDELHQFSESLLAEVEKLQLQVQDRDAEISFLRQEVTRCTNEVLVASQMSSKKGSDEIHEILTWLDALLSEAAMQDAMLNDGSHAHEYKEILQKKIASILSQLADLQIMAQKKDSLLQTERGKVEELKRREEILEKALHEKESQLNMLEEIGDSGRPASSASEILEVEPVMNKRTVPGPTAVSQVRSLRKVNNDQVAIAIDMDAGGSNRLEDEDDDKVHGFKSLTSSRIVPKFTRPMSDMIDGLWVSCDRALMRQPALRLGIIIYWALLHALLATFVF